MTTLFGRPISVDSVRARIRTLYTQIKRENIANAM